MFYLATLDQENWERKREKKKENEVNESDLVR